MIPVILISNNSKKSQQFVEEFIVEHHILPYYVFKIIPEKEEISIGQVRLIKKEIITSIKEKRLFVIESFDNASLEAQNALLKTLEENTKNNIFILLANNSERILGTIRSRSKIIILDKNLHSKSKYSELFNLICDDNSLNIKYLSHKSVLSATREDALQFFDELIIFFQGKLKTGFLKYSRILKKGIALRQILRDNNLNPQLTVDNMLIFIKKEIKVDINH